MDQWKTTGPALREVWVKELQSSDYGRKEVYVPCSFVFLAQSYDGGSVSPDNSYADFTLLWDVLFHRFRAGLPY